MRMMRSFAGRVKAAATGRRGDARQKHPLASKAQGKHRAAATRLHYLQAGAENRCGRENYNSALAYELISQFRSISSC
jgi:hypothetical protein